MTLEQRIAAIEDREAITDLILEHAEIIRSGRAEGQVRLFADDAFYEIHHFDPARPGESVLHQRIEGVEQIAAGKDAVAGAETRLWPQIHNIRVALDGDRATATCVLMATTWPMGSSFIAEYRDAFRREAGGWRFAARRVYLFGNLDGTYAEEAHQRYLAVKE